MDISGFFYKTASKLVVRLTIAGISILYGCRWHVSVELLECWIMAGMITLLFRESLTMTVTDYIVTVRLDVTLLNSPTEYLAYKDFSKVLRSRSWDNYRGRSRSAGVLRTYAYPIVVLDSNNKKSQNMIGLCALYTSWLYSSGYYSAR